MRRPVLAFLAVLVALGACNTSSTPNPPFALPTPTAPQTIYTGSITDSLSGSGTVTVTLGTAGSSVGGTWSAAFPDQKSSTRYISGTVTGTSYTATVSCSSPDGSLVCIPDCRQILTATLTSGTLSGTYTELAGDTCAARSGSLNANRQ